ncbi:MAG: NTP transferase domain-containing protein [Bacteroidales bacterium]|nr:NTP transferase domain-containing protein [Bacteroidales bacterium]
MSLPKNDAIILAAGRSARYGQAKFSLKFDAEITFLEKIVAEYIAFGCENIVVVVNTESLDLLQDSQFFHKSEAKSVINPNPESGRFSSIKIGMAALKESNATFIQNVDNPFVNLNMLHQLADNLTEYAGICPTFHGKGGHPLLLSEKLVIALKSENYHVDFKQFLTGFEIQKMEVNDPGVLANINTREDYERWFGSISAFPGSAGAKP